MHCNSYKNRFDTKVSWNNDLFSNNKLDIYKKRKIVQFHDTLNRQLGQVIYRDLRAGRSLIFFIWVIHCLDSPFVTLSEFHRYLKVKIMDRIRHGFHYGKWLIRNWGDWYLSLQQLVIANQMIGWKVGTVRTIITTSDVLRFDKLYAEVNCFALLYAIWWQAYRWNKRITLFGISTQLFLSAQFRSQINQDRINI